MTTGCSTISGSTLPDWRLICLNTRNDFVLRQRAEETDTTTTAETVHQAQGFQRHAHCWMMQYARMFLPPSSSDEDFEHVWTHTGE